MTFTKRSTNVLLTNSATVFLLAATLFLLCAGLETFDFWESLYRQLASNIKATGDLIPHWNGTAFVEPSRIYLLLCAGWDAIWNEHARISALSLRVLHLALSFCAVYLISDGRKSLVRLALAAPLFLISATVVNESALQFFALASALFFGRRAAKNFGCEFATALSLALVCLTHDLKLLGFEAIALFVGIWLCESRLDKLRWMRIFIFAGTTLFFAIRAAHPDENLFALFRSLLTVQYFGEAARWHGETPALQHVVGWLGGSAALGFAVVKGLAQHRLGLLARNPIEISLAVALVCYVLSVSEQNFWSQLLLWAPALLVARQLKDAELDKAATSLFESICFAVIAVSLFAASALEKFPVVFDEPLQGAFRFAATDKDVRFVALVLVSLSIARYFAHVQRQLALTCTMVLVVTMIFLIPFEDARRFKWNGTPVDEIATLGLFLPSVDLAFEDKRVRHFAIDDERAFEVPLLVTSQKYLSWCEKHGFATALLENEFAVCRKR